MTPRYRDLNSVLRARFGCRVQKISVDAGFSCPNRDGTIGTDGCIYCNARGSGTGAHALGVPVAQQIESGKAAMARRYHARKFIAYFQAFSNTHAPVERLRAVYIEALGVEGVVGLAIGTRPDCVDGPVLDLLQELARDRLVWLEIGLQTACDRTLASIGRGHDTACFLSAVAAAHERGLPVCAHVILGLPGEESAEMRRTAEVLADAAIDGVKLHHMYVVRGTRLEALYLRGEVRCLAQEEYVTAAVDFLERIPADAVVQRLTGDPAPDELAAPAWSLDKAGTLRLLQAELERRDTVQGRLCVKPRRPAPVS
jgi:radical SAM protein (TIGR01212 family)